MQKIKSISEYFFLICKFFLFKLKIFYFKTNFYNKKISNNLPSKFNYKPSLHIINSLTSFSKKKIKSYNIKAGVSLNPETSVDKVLDILNLIDLILIMSVNPGFGGQKFIKETIEKVKLLRKEIDQKKFAVEIEIDGGINFDNAKIAKKAGVDILVSGTTIFKNNEGNIKKNIETLRNH